MKTNLPPQAYTRDVFANAYEWLQTQSESIKELAQTPDDLVALYLQARRHGHLNNTQNVSKSKSFKNDLKNLAEGLRQFEEGHGQQASAVTEKIRETTKHSFTFTNPPPPPNYNYGSQQIIEDPVFSHEDMPPIREYSPQPIQKELLDEENFERPMVKKPSEKKPMPMNIELKKPNSDKLSGQNESWDLANLDSKSKLIIEDVKTRLNLSRDEEALRMLLVLGSEKLKEILPLKP